MKKSLLQRLTPHALAIAIFLVISCVYCLPALKGLIVNQYDMLGTIGAKQQSEEFKQAHGHLPLWTNSVFSGMPAYQIAIESKYNVSLTWAHYLFTLCLPSPASLFFLCCICFYILCIAMRLKPWIGIFGALAYAFCSYNPILVETGHVTKLAAMGYAPAVLAGVVWLAQRKYFLGFAATLLFGTLMINQNHVQITYYVFIIIGCIGVAYAVHTIRQKEIKHLLLTGGLAAVALAIGMFSFSTILLPMNEYAKETMRGGRSELTAEVDTTQKAAAAAADKNKSKGGLDKDYAFQWSYGIGETTTLMVPASRGGGSGLSELPEDNHTIEALQEARLPSQAANFLYSRMSAYWGDQPFTSGPVYFGAIVCLLFIAGLFLVRGWHLGWIVAATVIGIVLAWGNHLPSVNYFLFDHLPYYNKLRAPAMALVIPQITMVLLACIALQQLFYGNLAKPELMKKLKGAGIAAAAVILILAFDYFSADYKSVRDKQVSQVLTQMVSQGGEPNEQMLQQANTIANSLNSAIEKDRAGLYSSDFIRMIIFVLLGAAVIWLGASQKLKAQYAIIALTVLSLIDLIQVDRRYLKNENYVDKDEYMSFFTPTQADLQIKQDTGYFRVLDEARGALSDDARASYHHNSVGGYHPAKLALYDDLLNRQLRRYNMRVFNMLNTKYFIVSPQQGGQPVAQQNPDALGAAWLVKGIQYVNNADEEMKALDTFNPADTVIIDKREQSKIPFTPQFDSTAHIKLVKNENDIITYQFNAATNQFVVFSEIYYPYGWNAYVDGKQMPIARVNYTLRGMAIPAGNHTIVFRFEPAIYAKANTIGLIIGIVSILLFAFCLWQAFKRKEIETATEPAKA
ncbi:MAG: YfhO family protein [Chitinophagaceae bacterium]